MLSGDETGPQRSICPLRGSFADEFTPALLPGWVLHKEIRSTGWYSHPFYHRPITSTGLIFVSIPMVQNCFACSFSSQDPSFILFLLAGNAQSCFHEGWHNGRPMTLQSRGLPSPIAALFVGSGASCILLLNQLHQGCRAWLSMGWRVQLKKMHH